MIDWFCILTGSNLIENPIAQNKIPDKKSITSHRIILQPSINVDGQRKQNQFCERNSFTSLGKGNLKKIIPWPSFFSKQKWLYLCALVDCLYTFRLQSLHDVLYEQTSFYRYHTVFFFVIIMISTVRLMYLIRVQLFFINSFYLKIYL